MGTSIVTPIRRIIIIVIKHQPSTNFGRNDGKDPAVDSVPYDGVGPCAWILICIDMAVIVFSTYLFIISIETVIPKKQFACRRNKHTNN